MSATSRRAARREEQAAASLNSQRVHRRRGESAPDVVPVRLASGAVLGPEVKSRLRLPKVITSALAQARRYFGRRAIPIAVIFEKGQHGGIVALDLDAFARLVGLDVAVLPKARPLPRPGREPQLELFGETPARPRP